MPTLATNDLQQRLDAMVDAGAMPGAQLAVLTDGQTTTVASGVLNTNTAQPVTTDSLFQIGSITKVWTATAIMQMVDEGKIDLDTPIKTYLPELTLGGTDTAERVTLRHLLTHTSGIEGDVFDDTGHNDDALVRYLGLLAELDPVHGIDETWSYCNAGFAIAGHLIALDAGTTYEQAIRDRIVAPLGISRFAWNADEAILQGSAVGHLPGPDGPVVAPRWGLPRNAAPAGLISTTAADLLTFAAAHLDHGTAPSGKPILSSRSTAAMQEPQVACPSSIADSWGIGWTINDWDGLSVIGHNGGTLGQYAQMFLFPEHDAAIALLVNGSLGTADHALLTELVRDVVGGSFRPLPTPTPGLVVDDPDRVVGRYRRYGFELDITRAEDGGLSLTLTATGPLTVIHGTEPKTVPLLPTLIGGEFLAPSPTMPGLFTLVTFYGGDGQPPFLHTGGRVHVRRE